MKAITIINLPREAYRNGMLWPIEASADNEREANRIAHDLSIARPDADFIIQTSLPVVHRNGCSELV